MVTVEVARVTEEVATAMVPSARVTRETVTVTTAAAVEEIVVGGTEMEEAGMGTAEAVTVTGAVAKATAATMVCVKLGSLHSTILVCCPLLSDLAGAELL